MTGVYELKRVVTRRHRGYKGNRRLRLAMRSNGCVGVTGVRRYTGVYGCLYVGRVITDANRVVTGGYRGEGWLQVVTSGYRWLGLVMSN